MKVAAITMVHNEPVMLSWWLRYYSAQVGAEQCYVIDHGSNDGSTAALGEVNKVKVPYGEFDEGLRAEFIADFCASLLRWYDWVIYTDVDEMVVPDPSVYDNLTDYCAGEHPDVVTAFGVNVLHRLHHEVQIDASRKLLAQRWWVFPASSMAKPLLLRVPVRSPGGFHSCEAPMQFDGLVNFHLAYIDLDTTIARQAGRRNSRINHASHHQMTDAETFQMMENWSAMPIIEDISLDKNCEHTSSFINQILASNRERTDEIYKVDLDIWGKNLWNVPQRYRSIFNCAKLPCFVGPTAAVDGRLQSCK